jgi:hypothetical protein
MSGNSQSLYVCKNQGNTTYKCGVLRVSASNNPPQADAKPVFSPKVTYDLAVFGSVSGSGSASKLM